MKNTEHKICNTCGTWYRLQDVQDNRCRICDDDRQYVPEGGQAWINPGDLRRHRSVQIKEVSDHVYELTVLPSFGIGQRAFLILSDKGNILWDCIPLLDEGAKAFIQTKGGLKAIAISHPHYYSNMSEWASAFSCPVYIHAKDKEWVPDERLIQFWNDEVKDLWEDMKIINTGGHFPGACILHVPFLPERGTVFAGDSLFISRNRKHISIMYSYPNIIPLPLSEIERIRRLMEKYPFDRMYGAFAFQNLTSDVQTVWERSMKINLRGTKGGGY